MQRMKGQGGPVSNGPKDPVNDEEFDSWRNQHHPSYNTPMSASGMGDPYMSSYYGMSFPPYQNLGLNEGAWSNGSETMTFLGGYSGQMGNEQHSHYMDGMLGGGGAFGGFSQPGFNYFHGNGDYSAWGTSGVGRKPAGHAQHYDEYYREVYGTDPGTDRAMAAAASAAAAAAALKPLEQGMQSLGLTDKVDSKGDGKPAGPMVVDHGKIGAGQTGAPGVVAEGLAMTAGNSGGPQAPKKMTWASVASQPAKPQPKIKPKSIPPAPMLPGKHNNLDIGTWESKNGNAGKGSVSGGPAVSSATSASTSSSRAVWVAPRGRGSTGSNVPSAYPAPTGMNPAVGSNAGMGVSQVPPGSNSQTAVALGPCTYPQHPILDKLRQTNDYNPKEYDLNPKNVRFFIIKSYSEDDIHRSIKYGIWCSTEHGNKRLDGAYREMEGRGAVYLLFSVNGSGHFCGMAQMMSEVDHNATSNVWAQDKWKGVFRVKWIYVKDVPNSQLRHIRLENNENKPVTNSRDTQEVPTEKGKQVLKIMHVYRHSTSIFDDFVHYEKRQEEEDQRRQVPETLVRLQQVKGRRGQPN